MGQNADNPKFPVPHSTPVFFSMRVGEGASGRNFQLVFPAIKSDELFQKLLKKILFNQFFTFFIFLIINFLI